MDCGDQRVPKDVDIVLNLSVINEMDVVRVRLDGLHQHALVCMKIRPLIERCDRVSCGLVLAARISSPAE